MQVSAAGEGEGAGGKGHSGMRVVTRRKMRVGVLNGRADAWCRNRLESYSKRGKERAPGGHAIAIGCFKRFWRAHAQPKFTWGVKREGLAMTAGLGAKGHQKVEGRSKQPGDAGGFRSRCGPQHTIAHTRPSTRRPASGQAAEFASPPGVAAAAMRSDAPWARRRVPSSFPCARPPQDPSKHQDWPPPLAYRVLLYEMDSRGW
jgi:hypothetical protein